jgi:hypothetical protein
MITIILILKPILLIINMVYSTHKESLECEGMIYFSNYYNTIEYNRIQYNTIQYNTIQFNTIQYNTIQYNTIQQNKITLHIINYNYRMRVAAGRPARQGLPTHSLKSFRAAGQPHTPGAC